jgi:hypothetical protein
LAGQSTPLNVTVVDQFGKPFTGFDLSPFGSSVGVTVVKRDLSFLAAKSVQMNPGGSGMGGGGMGAPVAVNPAVPPPKREIRPEFVFPAEGQYVAFVDFWPRGGDKVVLAVPLAVGSALTPEAALTPDASLTQTVGDLRITMKTDGPLKANQYNYIDFDVIDAQGELRSDQIQMISGNLSELSVVDEKLKTFLRPDFLNRHKLRFSVDFPKPGRYELWFSFYYADSADLSFEPATAGKYAIWYMRTHPNQLQRLAFVVDVE